VGGALLRGTRNAVDSHVGEQGKQAVHLTSALGLMHKFVVLPPLFAAQHELLHFASRVLGQAAELDGSRALEMRQVLTAEGNDLGFGRTVIRFQSDKCLGALPPLLIGDSDDGTL
jgi:hypothetical protein